MSNLLPRLKSIKIRLTEAEHVALKNRATKSELATWMREYCLGAKLNPQMSAPKCDPALLRQLTGIGNNLNQIARAINQKTVAGQEINMIVLTAQLASIERQLNELKP